MTARSAPVSPSVPGAWLWLLLIVLGALVVRLLELGTEPLWFDEIMTRKHLEGDPVTVAKGIVTRIDPPLYYLFMGGWIPLTGESEFWMRLPSLLAGVASVVLVARVARPVFGEAVALAAAALLAVHPMAVTYSQEARFYVFEILLALLSCRFLRRVLDGERGRAAWGYVLATAGLFYMHFIAALLPVAQTAFALLGSRDPARRPAFARLVRLQVLVAALTVPYLAGEAYLYLVEGAGHRDWIQTLGGTPDHATLLATIGNLVGGPASGHPLPRPHLAWTRPVVWILGGTFLALGVLARRRDPRAREEVALHASSIAVPVLGLFLVSQFGSIYLDRYLIFCVPSVVLLMARGMTTLGPPRAMRHAAVVLVTVTLAALLVHWPDWRKADWPSVHRTLSRDGRAGDVLVVGGTPGGMEETTSLDFQRRHERAHGPHGVRTVALPYEAFAHDARGALPESWVPMVDEGRVRWRELLAWIATARERRLWIAFELAPHPDVADNRVFLETPEYRALESACGPPSRIHRTQRMELRRFDLGTRDAPRPR